MQKINKQIEEKKKVLLAEQEREREGLIQLGQTLLEVLPEKDKFLQEMADKCKEKETLLSALEQDIGEIQEKTERQEQIRQEEKELAEQVKKFTAQEAEALEELGRRSWNVFQNELREDTALIALFTDLTAAKNRIEALEEDSKEQGGKAAEKKLSHLLAKGQRLVLETRRRGLVDSLAKLYRKAGARLDSENLLSLFSGTEAADSIPPLKERRQKLQALEEAKTTLKIENDDIKDFFKKNQEKGSPKKKINSLKEKSEETRQEQKELYLAMGEYGISHKASTEKKELAKKREEVLAVQRKRGTEEEGLKTLQIRQELGLLEKERAEWEDKVTAMEKSIEEKKTSLKSLKKGLQEREKKIIQKKKALPADSDMDSKASFS